MQGISFNNVGVDGSSFNSYGVYGFGVTDCAGFFNGDVHVNGTVTEASDRRLKEGISTLSRDLRDVMQLRPVSFTWKQKPNGRIHFGLIAQEAEAVVPELVTTGRDADQLKGINYNGFVPILINAIQEQQDTIVALDARIRALEQALERSRPEH